MTLLALVSTTTTRRAVADTLGVTSVAVGKWAAGQTAPDYRNRLALKARYQIDDASWDVLPEDAAPPPRPQRRTVWARLARRRRYARRLRARMVPPAPASQVRATASQVIAAAA
jgi:transcriptional regulator with XRE-family HTH domain